jgi:hypothetical protein
MSTSGIARNDGSQNVHFIGKDVTYNTVGIGTADTVKVGRVPAGLVLAPHMVHITTAFNAATTNVLTVGANVCQYGHRCGRRTERGRNRSDDRCHRLRADVRERYRHLRSVHANRNGGHRGRRDHSHHLHPPELVRTNIMTSLVVDGELMATARQPSTGAALLVNGTTVFTVAGGPILITDLVSYVIVGGDSTAATLQWSADGTVGAATTFTGGLLGPDQPCGWRRRLLQLHRLPRLRSSRRRRALPWLAPPHRPAAASMSPPASSKWSSAQARPSPRPISTSCGGFPSLVA